MQCINCPFSLRCLAGCLGGSSKNKPQNTMLLCPKCGKFVYTPNDERDHNIYAFFCEQRLITDEIKLKWTRFNRDRALFDRINLNTGKDSGWYPGHLVITDPESNNDKLYITECLACCHALSILNGVQTWINLDIKWINLDIKKYAKKGE